MMRKRLLIVVCILFIITGCKQKLEYRDREDNRLTFEEKLDIYISNMSLEEKIAQMLIVYTSNPSMTPEFQEELELIKPGGFIVQGANITSYQDTLDYINQIKQTARIPMIISIDQEGGIVQRLTNLTDINPTYIPPMYDLGETNDQELSYQVGKVIATELRTIGVNVDYAPVLDVYTNYQNTVIGNRAFGSNIDSVINMALPLSKGILDSNVIPVYKHFPGHGDTAVDSHFGLPVVTKTLEDIKQLELQPFIKAIEDNASMIMVAHIAYPNITGDNTPASLSYEMVTEVLRNDLGYKGIVISDGLNMGTLTNNYSYSEIYEKAINAGVDLLLMPLGIKEPVDSIKNSIETGRIQIERINESVKRILTLKFTYLHQDNTLGKEHLGSQEHRDIIDIFN